MVHPPRSPPVDPHPAHRCRDLDLALRDAFGTSFTLWQQREGRWEPASHDAFDDTVHESGEWLELLTSAAADATRPHVLAGGDGGHMLALPLGGESPSPLIATAVCRPGREQLLASLGRLFLKEHATRRQLASCRRDLEVSAQQISEDLEDISFWRELAQRLDIRDHSQDVWTMARGVLPLVGEAIAAQSVVLVTATRHDDGNSTWEVGPPAVWYGPAPVDENVCRQLVLQHREAAQRQPVVRNHVESSDQATRLNGLRQFVLAPVAKEDFVLGWLLAVNRVQRDAERSQPASSGAKPLAALPGADEFGSIEASLLASTATMFATHARNVHLLRERESLLLAADRAKNAFLAGLSTRLQEPLSMILGFGRTLLETGEAAACLPHQTQVIRQMLGRGEQVLAVVDNLLDLSQLEAGAVTATKSSVSPIRSVDEVVCLMHGRANEAGISLEVQHDFPQPAEIHTDPARLRQILINLLDNAIKASARGNSVRLVTRLATSECDPRLAEPLMYFEVIDAGEGIAPRQIGRLFEPFSREAGASSTAAGLGLAISRRLARLLGGDLTVESCVGKGSTFRVVIPAGSLDGMRLLDGPAQSKGDPGAPLRQPLTQASVPRRLLLVENEPQHRQAATLLCGSLGIDLTVSADAQTGLEHALVASDAGRPFDLVLFSSHLAVLDGFEAARVLRQQGYRGPLIALVDRDTEQHRRRSHQAGCDEYLLGPLDGPKLLGLMRKHFALAPPPHGATSGR